MSVPTLLPYQARWVQDKAGLKVCEKSRRIGLSWTESYDSVMHAGEGLGNIYYQSYAQDMTRGFIDDCADWAFALNRGAGAVDEVLIDLGDDEKHPAFRLPMASGKEIFAMTSAPRAFRSKGRPGDVGIVDEAAFVDSLAEVLKAAMAFRIWGGSVHVLSTHNGESSPFNELVREVRDGERPGSLHKITFDQAVADGVYQRICRGMGVPWTAEGERQWVAEVRAEYGVDAAEELDCIPSPGGGAWLSWALIRAAENDAYERIDEEDGTRHVLALADAGDRCGNFYIGVDIARRRDLWVAVVIEVVGDVRWVRELVVMRNIPFSQQHDIIDDLVARYRPVRVAIDQTGMGEEFVEIEQRKHGEYRVEGVLLTGPRRLDIATAILECAQDAALRIPNDADVRRDLHAVRAETGTTGGPRLVADRDTDGHADRFWALALAVAAAATPATEYSYTAVKPDTRDDGRRPKDRMRRKPPRDDSRQGGNSGRWDSYMPAGNWR